MLLNHKLLIISPQLCGFKLPVLLKLEFKHFKTSLIQISTAWSHSQSSPSLKGGRIEPTSRCGKWHISHTGKGEIIGNHILRQCNTVHPVATTFCTFPVCKYINLSLKVSSHYITNVKSRISSPASRLNSNEAPQITTFLQLKISELKRQVMSPNTVHSLMKKRMRLIQ